MTAEHEHDRQARAPHTPEDAIPSIVDAPTPDAEARFVAETAARSRQTRIGWEVAVGVIVIVLIGAGIAYALLGRGTTSDQPAEQSAAALASLQPSASDSTASGVASRTVVDSGTPAPGGAQISRAAKPTERLATEGQPLSELSAPPAKTVAMLVVPKGFKAAAFDIVFQPYGWGPGGVDGGRILVRIDSSRPADAGAKALEKDFMGRNAAVWCSPADAKILADGGTYSGVLTVRPQGNVGSLYLSQVKPDK